MVTDWKKWQPKEKCVLCFVIQDGRILLIRKKRGLGAGKINGPGGRIDAGESAQVAAIRECEEELHITPEQLQIAGELSFQFVDGYAMHCTVFAAATFRGTPEETEEAAPLWFGLDAIPFEAMWADDKHWFPSFLEGKYFAGYFSFDAETLLEHALEFPAGSTSQVELKQSITAAIT